MLCTRCNVKMIHTMRFEADKSCEFEYCPKCYFETKHKRIKFPDTKTEKVEKPKQKPKKKKKVKK